MVKSLTTDQLITLLDNRDQADVWLDSLGIMNKRRAHQNLLKIAEQGVTLDLLARICERLGQHLPLLSDPDMAINNLERFVLASRSPLSLASLFERDDDALPVLLRMFSSSQHLSDVLIQEPETYDLLRITEGFPVSREILVEELLSEIQLGQDERHVMKLLRLFKRRETARIVYGDVVRGQRLEIVSRQISLLADAICEAALVAAGGFLEKRYGRPLNSQQQPAKFVAIALGKLGGLELNYSSDIDLMFVYDEDGETDGTKRISNREYFERLARLFVKLIGEATDRGICYRVDLRLRPEGDQGPMVIGRSAAINYYESKGRTWERQAFVKARPVAGCLPMGQRFLEELTPWIYHRYLSRADIVGIQALKRRIELRTKREGGDLSDVKHGHGGIRDIEFVIQFLQLLNGGELAEIRTGNTLEAITRLEQSGCLTMQERSILEESYAFLRKIEHRLQIMFDLQTHSLPADDRELRKLAIRMGLKDDGQGTALEKFKQEYQDRTALNRKILDHLLHDSFASETSVPEVDLVLDPEPSTEAIHETLKRCGFRDMDAAYRNLMALAQEKIPFLSTRRCRLFLASIAPRLLKAVGQTPDPDATLVSLARVSDSLGGKGVLWELFSASPASMDLCIRLCAGGAYLTTILTSNPGMIDELMDSLILDRLPDQETILQELSDRCRRAEDIQPILHSFKNSLHLQVGVRDLLGKDDIRETTLVLSDIAEACLQQVTLFEYRRLTDKFGIPSVDSSDLPQRSPADASGSPPWVGLPSAEDTCELVILGVGKLGGREPNYHSDLDVIFLYESDGMTRRRTSRDGETTSNQHFFSELAQRIIKSITQLGPQGRLFEMDPRLRPTGRSGALAVSFEEFSRYFAAGEGGLWERQALCKARPIFGSAAARQQVMERVKRIIRSPRWQASQAIEIFNMRLRLQDDASERNLKRGPGGTMDIEFAVQMLQLRFIAEHPDVAVPGTLDAIGRLRDKRLISTEDADYLAESYRFLRSVESRLRLMNTIARHDLPTEQTELVKLAYLLREPDSVSISNKYQYYTRENRNRFERLFDVVSA